MKRKKIFLLAALSAATFSLMFFDCSIGAAARPEVSFTVKTAKDAASSWPKEAAAAADAMLAKYGAPDGITGQLLTWHDAGPWLEMTVRRDVIDHSFPSPHRDTLEQVVAYEVPEEKFSDLARFDGSIIAERTAGTLSSRSQSEAMNFLALNLAHDIITNRRNVEEAREMYADIAKAYANGEQHPYTRGLRFMEAETKDTMDPDYSPG
ncbi:hypothetical protein BAC1_01104 [uncultured bacterium]|nr:hypothetical protein BAC1_01104 [uncultured bacterium]